jgi:phosphate transport system permease protein
MGIVAFLLWEVRPLFLGAELQGVRKLSSWGKPLPALLFLDENGAIGYGIERDGRPFAFHAPTGTPLSCPSWDLGEKNAAAFGFSQDKGRVALGLSDGTFRLGILRVVSSVKGQEELPSHLDRLSNGDLLGPDGVLYRPLSTGGFLTFKVLAELGEAKVASKGGHPIKAIQLRTGGTEERPTFTVAALDEGSRITVERIEVRKNLLTGKETEFVETREIGLPSGELGKVNLLLGSRGDYLALLDPSGRFLRYNPFGGKEPQLLEDTALLPSGIEVGSAALLPGDRALVLGCSDGVVRIFFLVEDPSGTTPDGRKTVLAKELEAQEGPIVAMDVAFRGKLFATGDGKGQIWLRHSTSEKTLAKFSLGGSKEMVLALAPRMDGILVLGDANEGAHLVMRVPHPETSWKTLFGKVWYEGHPGPQYVWQSTGGTEEFEPKLSLVPLIFGTMKGTFYSLLMAVPIAIMAAIFTSEFLGPSVRGKVKPIMEVMASLPSVILGFVAALVLAPFVEVWIFSIILAFLMVPLSLIAGGYIFQILPHEMRLRWEGSQKLLVVGCALVGGVILAIKLGPVLEDVFFCGDFKGWLAGGKGRSAPFLAMMLLPGTLVGASALTSRFALLGRGSKGQSLLRGAVSLCLGILGAIVMGEVLEGLGVDPRKGLVGTYVQRNTLIVAFAMGFAVIPIIYSLAEEALRAVPDHLRAASLACGATSWQTVLWVVLPAAASGIFSAIMIGMGRAVGETMIVVMATGNTPIMDINVFNGFRALSANIAVELPEAVKGGTLYRVLFLTALVLFSMTFLINTAAELVRQKFRKRSAQL